MLQGPYLGGGTWGPAAWQGDGEGKNERRTWMGEEKEEKKETEAPPDCTHVMETGCTS